MVQDPGGGLVGKYLEGSEERDAAESSMKGRDWHAKSGKNAREAEAAETQPCETSAV